MSEYKKPMDLTPCAPHLIAVHFGDENYTATPGQQKLLCDEMWKRWANYERLVSALDSAATVLEIAGYVDTASNHRALLASMEAEKGGEL